MPNSDPTTAVSGFGPLAWRLLVTMPDHSVWSVPVSFIASHRARYFAGSDGVPFTKAMTEDTLPLFEFDEDEIIDWAANNLNWSDVASVAKLVKPGDVDWEDGWANGDKWVEKVRT